MSQQVSAIICFDVIKTVEYIQYYVIVSFVVLPIIMHINNEHLNKHNIIWVNDEGIFWFLQ